MSNTTQDIPTCTFMYTYMLSHTSIVIKSDSTETFCFMVMHEIQARLRKIYLLYNLMKAWMWYTVIVNCQSLVTKSCLNSLTATECKRGS